MNEGLPTWAWQVIFLGLGLLIVFAIIRKNNQDKKEREKK